MQGNIHASSPYNTVYILHASPLRRQMRKDNIRGPRQVQLSHHNRKFLGTAKCFQQVLKINEEPLIACKEGAPHLLRLAPYSRSLVTPRQLPSNWRPNHTNGGEYLARLGQQCKVASEKPRRAASCTPRGHRVDE